MHSPYYYDRDTPRVFVIESVGVHMSAAVGATTAVNSWEVDAGPRVTGESYYAVTAWAGVSGLSRDRRMVGMHFQDLTGTQSLATLASTIAANWTIWSTGLSHSGTVTIYKSDFAPPGTPHPPLAQATMTGGAFPPHGPGELSLCLSYFSVFNVKRARGRIFIPFDLIWLAQASGSSPSNRPTAADQQAALAVWDTVIKPIDHGGNFDWVLKSPTDKAFKPITDIWVDNEWDTVRSRGLRGDARITAKT